MPVMTRIITAASGSTRNDRSMVRSSDEIQVYSVCSIARCAGSIPTICQTVIAETMKEATIASEARPPDTLLGSRRPSIEFTRNPTTGKSGMSASIATTSGW